jgi:uncharacterized membrane protein YjfL (UPF0719 family)
MNQLGQLVVGVVNIIIAIILGVLASYSGMWLFSRSTRHLDDWGEVRRGNTGMGIVLAAIIIGIAIILKPVVDMPLTIASNPGLVLVGEILGIGVALALALSAIVFSVGLFGRLMAGNHIDELSELQNGNLAVAVIMAGVILAVSLLISGAVAAVVRWFVTFLAA